MSVVFFSAKAFVVVVIVVVFVVAVVVVVVESFVRSAKVFFRLRLFDSDEDVSFDVKKLVFRIKVCSKKIFFLQIFVFQSFKG